MSTLHFSTFSEDLLINMPGDNLLWPDYLVIGLYLALVLAVGLWVSFILGHVFIGDICMSNIYMGNVFVDTVL